MTNIEQLKNDRDIFQHKAAKLSEELTAYRTKFEHLEGRCDTKKENTYGNIKDCDSMYTVQD